MISRFARSARSLRAHASTSVAMPLTRCSRPTLTISGRPRRCGLRLLEQRAQLFDAPGVTAPPAAASAASATAVSIVDRSTPSGTMEWRSACDRQVDAHEPAHVLIQPGPREQHGVRCVRREALDEPRAEPEVLARCRRRRTSRASAVPARSSDSMTRVRVGRDREDHRDAELARDVRGGEAADIRHPQVEQVDASRPRAAGDGCRGAP